ncbi:MAG: efflux RND transporter permease subunit [Eubacterium sp.]|nr:efflux RND transporter permease subunit [Eubacterium sp.]
MNLTKFVLSRPVSTALVILGIMVFGFISILGFDMELIPDIEVPMMVVYTVYPGASPGSVEELVTKKVEDAGDSLSGVTNTLTYSYENYSMVIFQYDYDQDMNDSYTDLSAALDQLSLPDDVKDPTIILMDINALDTITISATNNGASDMLSYVNDTVVPQLESTPGVARVTVTGGRENYIRVRLNEDKMDQYGLNISGVAAMIGAGDYNIPAGSVTAGSQDISLSTSDEYITLQDIRSTVITTSRGSMITLDDIADISYASKKPTSISRYNGEENITISVVKKQSASTVRVANNAKRVIRHLEADSSDINYDISYDAGHEITDALMNVAKTLALGVVFAMAVLFLFFGDWKASLIVGSSMPVSVFATLVLMNLFGFNLNIITTGALVIAIGMIVDSSIVVIESCFRSGERSETAEEAAVSGASIVTMSIVASTITTIVVYLPLSLIKGMAGQMFSQLGLIIVFAMLCSLISALCIVPILYVAVKPAEKKNSAVNRFLDRVRSLYDRIIRKVLKRKVLTLVLTVLLLILSGYLVSLLGVELIPASYDGSIRVTTTFRSGTKLDVMSETMKDLEKMVEEDKNFDNYSLTIQQNQAVLTAFAGEKCTRSSADAVEEYTKKLDSMTNVDILVSPSGGDSTTMSGYSADTVDVVLSSDDIDSLQKGSRQVQNMMYEVPGVIHVSSDGASAQTSGHVVVDPLKAANAGLAPAQVAAELYQTMAGVTAANIEVKGDQYDIILEYPEGAYDNINQLMNKTLTGATGKQTKLSEIATVEYKEQPQMLQKSNGKYQQTTSATVTKKSKSKAQKTINKKAAALNYPSGVALSSSLIQDVRSENLTAIFRAILSGIFLVFLVMAMQFESVRFSLMVMTCIPFSLIGSFLLLFLTGTSLNMVSMMGFLMLMGIAVNNGILLVDTVNYLKEDMPLEEALIEAGKIRLRPILMTTLTTILAMVPMAVSSNNEMLHSMSFVIIGGLVASTILCLFMMPTYYLLIARKSKSKEKKKRKEK